MVGDLCALGTDAGVYPHGENAAEFGYMAADGMPADIVNRQNVGVVESGGALGFLEQALAVGSGTLTHQPAPSTVTTELTNLIEKKRPPIG